MKQQYILGLLKVKLLGHQPAAKISDQLLNALIAREFRNSTDIVKTKLNNIDSDRAAGKNRIAEGILKLADENLVLLDELKSANRNYRDILMWAEYLRNAKLGFEELDKIEMKQNLY